MNCTNCAAPLTATSQGGSFLCTYCRSHQVLHELRVNGDGVVDLDRRSEHDCPACGQRMNAALMDDVSAEHCSGCRGVLLESELFAKVIANRRREFDGVDDLPTPIDSLQLEIRRDCPACHKRMETHPYYGPGNAVIDFCGRCRLIWLDAGEPVALVKAPGRRK